MPEAAEVEADELLEAEPDVETVEGADEGELQSVARGPIALEKNDRGLGELHRWYSKGRLIVDPEAVGARG